MIHLLAFVGVAAIVIVTPGQDTALTIRNTLVGGRRAGVATAAGVAIGQACWTLAASAGFAALVRDSRPAFDAIRVAGAIYLIWLGAATVSCSRERDATTRYRGTSFRQGLLSNLGNPKMAVFFISLLPQFAAAFAALAALGVVFCTMTFAWLSAYAAVIARAGAFLSRPRVRRALDAITGSVLIALGVRVASEH
jgi:threonine/homoserine/homoserine lactone efflux protein